MKRFSIILILIVSGMIILNLVRIYQKNYFSEDSQISIVCSSIALISGVGLYLSTKKEKL